MAIQTRGTFTELYDNIDKSVFTILFDAQKELPKIWADLINVKSSDRKFERVMSVTGVGDIPEKGEGAPLHVERDPARLDEGLHPHRVRRHVRGDRDGAGR